MNTPVLNETGLEPLAARAVALPTVTGSVAGGALAVMRDYAMTVREVEGFVAALVDTPFVPDSHWPLPVGVTAKEMPNGNPRLRHRNEDEATWRIRRSIAIASGTGSVLTGLPLGLDPLVALSQVFLVKGKPGLYTKIKLAMVQARGHDVWDVERSNERVTVAGRRKGWPQERAVTITITMEDAVRAKWTTNDTYEKTPADMLWSRAASRVLDRIAGDVLFGIPSVEDLGDSDTPAPSPGPWEAVTAAPAGAGAVGDGPAKLREILAEQQKPAGPEEATADAPAGVPDQPAHEPWPISDQQWRKINARFVELGVTGPGRDLKRLAVISEIVGRLIERGGQLSAAEADLVLDNLAGMSGAELVTGVLNPVDASIGDADPDTDEAANNERGDEDSDADGQDSEQQGRAALEGVPDPWGINS